MFGLFKRKIVIDNSDEAVKRRVNYLRMKNPATKGIFVPVNDEVIAKIPREIEWCYKGYAVGVGYSPYDIEHYKHKPEFLAEVKDCEKNAGWNKGGRPFTFSECAFVLISNDVGEFKYTPRNLMFYDEENIVLDYDFRKIGTAEELKIPDDLKAMGVDPRIWNNWIDRSLENYYWEGAGASDIPEHGFKGKDGVSYKIRVESAISLTINGVRSYAFNLTATEREKIIDKIRQGEIKGILLSDGKEYMAYVKRDVDTLAWSDEEIADSVNSLDIYGPRSSR